MSLFHVFDSKLKKITMTQHDRYQQAKNVTLIGALVNIALGLIKLIGGYCYHSHALVADGVHSLSDLCADVMILLASKYGSIDADDSHPYGHQRIETAATVLLSQLLIFAGIGIAWDAIYQYMMSSHKMIPGWLTLPIICLSIIANEMLFHYTHYVGNRINSPLITTNAWHHRSDAAASIVVLIALIGSLCGVTILDALAAIIVGILIVKMGWEYGWNSIKELVDTAVAPELLTQIEQVIYSITGVRKIHQLRSRFMGHDILIDVHILVSPQITVSEGHYIAEQVHLALIAQIARVKDVIVHVDPEDDELTAPSLDLPNRAMIQEQLLNEVFKAFGQISFWNLHYLEGTLTIDIVCPKHFTGWQQLHDQVNLALKSQKNIKQVRLFSDMTPR